MYGYYKVHSYQTDIYGLYDFKITVVVVNDYGPSKFATKYLLLFTVAFVKLWLLFIASVSTFGNIINIHSTPNSGYTLYYKLSWGGQGGRMVTLSPPTSEIGV